MKKFWNIGIWISGLALMVILLAFSGNCRQQTQLSSIDIKVDHHTGLYFVSEPEIEEILRSEYPYVDSLLCREININLLEERLDNHPAIRKAEVYSALNGSLSIEVNQKRPLFRVQNSGRAYYIDETGDSMALSPHYSAQVPLVTGSISASAEAEIFEFFEQIKEDEHFHDFFHGVHVKSNGEWILYPRVGRHTVNLGQPDKRMAKLQKLQIFYNRVVNEQNIDSIKVLNLAYENQVVRTKY
ncbi:MAG: cell division protein FtsQ/DivIB [Owenweeksia sp.]|nr:cell division protein FtsQ/DivIB [Owenweeksia sp.]